MRWFAFLLFLCLESHLGAVGAVSAQVPWGGCETEQVQYIRDVIAYKLGNGRSKLDTLSQQKRAMEQCNWHSANTTQSSLSVPLLSSSLLTSVRAIVDSLKSKNASHIWSLLPPAHKSHNDLLEESNAVQLQMPLLLYLSPNMWWVRSDPGFVGCYSAASTLYMLSWLTTGLFLMQLQILLEVPRKQEHKERKDLTFYAIAAIACSVLYPVVISRCAMTSGQTDCRSNARIRFNFIWPTILMTLFGFATSSETPSIDTEVDAFASFIKSAKQPLVSWEHGRALTQGKGISTESISASSPAKSPSRFNDYKSSFQLGVVALGATFLFFFMSCENE